MVVLPLTTYLNATLLALEESMRRFVDAPAAVANALATEHPPGCNGDAPAVGKPLVN